MKRMMHIWLICTGLVVVLSERSTANVFEKFKEGLQFAGKFMDFEKHAKDITKMVSEAFVSKSQDNPPQEKEHVFSGFLRLFGFGPKKLTAVVLNAIVFIAQLISTSFARTTPSQLTYERKIEGNPYDWLTNNSRISDLINYAKTENLSENVVKYIKENNLDEDSDCLQMLICKISPFVKAMQKTLVSKDKRKGTEILFEFLPNRSEVVANGVKCERRHPYCIVHF